MRGELKKSLLRGKPAARELRYSAWFCSTVLGVLVDSTSSSSVFLLYGGSALVFSSFFSGVDLRMWPFSIPLLLGQPHSLFEGWAAWRVLSFHVSKQRSGCSDFFSFFNVRTNVNACGSTHGPYNHRKRVHTKSGPWEKNLLSHPSWSRTCSSSAAPDPPLKQLSYIPDPWLGTHRYAHGLPLPLNLI